MDGRDFLKDVYLCYHLACFPSIESVVYYILIDVVIPHMLTRKQVIRRL